MNLPQSRGRTPLERALATLHALGRNVTHVTCVPTSEIVDIDELIEKFKLDQHASLYTRRGAYIVQERLEDLTERAA